MKAVVVFGIGNGIAMAMMNSSKGSKGIKGFSLYLSY